MDFHHLPDSTHETLLEVIHAYDRDDWETGLWEHLADASNVVVEHLAEAMRRDRKLTD